MVMKFQYFCRCVAPIFVITELSRPLCECTYCWQLYHLHPRTTALPVTPWQSWKAACWPTPSQGLIPVRMISPSRPGLKWWEKLFARYVIIFYSITLKPFNICWIRIGSKPYWKIMYHIVFYPVSYFGITVVTKLVLILQLYIFISAESC